MSSIDKLKSSAAKAVDNFDPNMFVETRDVLALLDELEHYKSREDRVTKLVLDNSASWEELYKKLEAAEKRIAELEDIAKSVKFDPIPMEDLGNKSDGKKHPYMFGAGYNSAVVHCESVLLQAFAAAAGKGGAS